MTGLGVDFIPHKISNIECLWVIRGLELPLSQVISYAETPHIHIGVKKPGSNKSTVYMEKVGVSYRRL